MTNITLNNEQKVHVKLNPKTKKGNPAYVDGKASFAVADGGTCTVEPDEDGLGATITSGDGADVAQTRITVTADADLGEGVTTLTEEIVVTQIPAPAASEGITVDEPVDK